MVDDDEVDDVSLVGEVDLVGEEDGSNRDSEE